MRIQTIQVVAALSAAVAFVIAFIAAGVALVSMLFGLLGSAALAWLVFTVAKRALSQRGARGVTTTHP